MIKKFEKVDKYMSRLYQQRYNFSHLIWTFVARKTETVNSFTGCTVFFITSFVQSELTLLNYLKPAKFLTLFISDCNNIIALS